MISIIIPMYNQNDLTKQCIEAIRHTTSDYEILVIDNGSEVPFQIPGSDVEIIRHEKNLGFPVAVNQGIEATNGEIICLLNNDVIVTKGWAEKLVSKLEHYDIIAPCTNYAAGMQRVVLPTYTNEEQLNDQAEIWSKEHQHTEEVAYVIGFCMLFSRILSDDIGPFDESLWPCSGEELDFCLRAREKGYKIGIAYDTYVHHYGSETFKKMQQAGELDYDEICIRNEKHVGIKWGDDFWEKQMIQPEKSA